MNHHYRASLSWSGSTGGGYDYYTREHRVTPVGKESLTLTSDPAFGGDAHLGNPEDLLVMAASSCQLLSFLAVAARARLDVVGYSDESSAIMEALGGEPMSISRITLRPVINLRAGSRIDHLHRIVQLAHRQCYIANSLRSILIIEARFLIHGALVASVRCTD